MTKLFCGLLAIATMACGIAKANEPVGIEVRKRNAIGGLALVRIQPEVRAQADAMAVVFFQAPEAGTYFLTYTSGPKAGKVAAIVRVEKAGPVTKKIEG